MLSPDTARLAEKVEHTLIDLMRQGTMMIVAWSSGKDSSCLLNLTLNAAIKARAEGITPCIIVTNSNTGVENPEVHQAVSAEIQRIEVFAEAHGIDCRVLVATPTLASHWAVKILSGRGLPVFANSSSRDCTIDFKIRPMNRLRNQLFREMGVNADEPVTLLGTRFEESASRASRMHSRGEDDVTPVTSPKDGTRYLSPIAYWSEEDVWEYLGVCKAGAIPAYSDFEDMFRIYAHSAGSSCAVVGADVTASNKNHRACGARTGCATCTAIGRDKSLEAMIDYDPRYAYARGLNLLQRFLVNTQYDLSRRNWVCRSVDDQGYIKFEPDTYHPKMLESLLRYALTLDVEEFKQAKALGLSAPRFQLIPLEALFAIDANWSLRGLHPRPFHALSIYHEIILEGKRYPVPEVEASHRVPIPRGRYLFVGNEWRSDAHRYHGLRDPLSELAAERSHCRGNRVLRDGREVLDIESGNLFSVDAESASLILALELLELLERHADPTASPTEGFRYYMRMGTVQAEASTLRWIDDTLRLSEEKHRLGWTRMDTEALLARSVSSEERKAHITRPQPAPHSEDRKVRRRRTPDNQTAFEF